MAQTPNLVCPFFCLFVLLDLLVSSLGLLQSSVGSRREHPPPATALLLSRLVSGNRSRRRPPLILLNLGAGSARCEARSQAVSAVGRLSGIGRDFVVGSDRRGGGGSLSSTGSMWARRGLLGKLGLDVGEDVVVGTSDG